MCERFHSGDSSVRGASGWRSGLLVPPWQAALGLTAARAAASPPNAPEAAQASRERDAMLWPCAGGVQTRAGRPDGAEIGTPGCAGAATWRLFR